MQDPAVTCDEFNDILEQEIPFAFDTGMRASEMTRGRAVLTMPVSDGMLRPGGTVSGPTMMSLADAAMYAVLLSEIGPVKLAVTTSFNANFLRKPEPAELSAVATILKRGNRLAVLQVEVFSEGVDGPVAHMTGTYSIPPDMR